MQWLIAVIILIVLVAVVVAFLNRFYRKASREVALVRTGAGGQLVAIDGGCLMLPFLHRVSEVNMKSLRLEVTRAGPRSLITEDRLRVDVTVEFFLRVRAEEEAIAMASQTLGGKSFRPTELAELIGGKLIGAVQGAVARHTMDQLHEDRRGFAAMVREAIDEELAKNGLEVESVALTQLDQTPFAALDENNAFNAVGMRRLAEVIAQNRKQRANIEADADIAVRQSRLDASKRRLIIEQEEQQAQIMQQLEIETMKARQSAEIAERQTDAERRIDESRIGRERDVRMAEIERDKLLRREELTSRLETELTERDNRIALAHKSSAESEAQAAAERSRAEAVAAAEAVQTEKDRATAERTREVAVIRAREQADVDAERLRSDVDTIRQEAEARAEAVTRSAEGKRAELLAEAEGRAAIIQAENTLSENVIRMKVDMHRMDRLPQIVAEMVRPAEKIDRIRISQVGGFGGGSGGSAGGGGDKPMVNQAIDGLLGMALQLPVLQKLGREIGIDLEDGLEGIARTAMGEKKDNKPSSGKAEEQGN